ncbi:MAG: zinc ribbon domain-containing protein, partial [Desulfobacteraceae bacterium]|nr:zinc ribbon domain-containing protein [Desulfobacteraceae bacterium]
MKCPQCQSENPDHKKFCRECGAKLSPTCPQCKAEIQHGDKFCGDCGYELEKSAEPRPVQEKEPEALESAP